MLVSLMKERKRLHLHLVSLVDEAVHSVGHFPDNWTWHVNSILEVNALKSGGNTLILSKKKNTLTVGWVCGISCG